LLISTIAVVFTGTGWAGYDPNPNIDVKIGLKLLLFLFPTIALVFAIIFLKSYDLYGEKLAKMREEIQTKKV
jgi:Na+/melibiose symporter-like transporter